MDNLCFVGEKLLFFVVVNKKNSLFYDRNSFLFKWISGLKVLSYNERIRPTLLKAVSTAVETFV